MIWCKKCERFKLTIDFHKSAIQQGRKRCIQCTVVYNATNRDKRINSYIANRDQVLKDRSLHYQANRERIDAQHAEYRRNNPHRVKEWNRRERLRNKDRISSNNKRYYQRKKRERELLYGKKVRKRRSPIYPFKERIRNAVRTAIRRGNFTKNSTTAQILCCEYVFFKKYIEDQFTDGMTWDNIHLDHIYPISLARTESEIYTLNHYTNFQPLFVQDNLLKSNKVPDQIPFIVKQMLASRNAECYLPEPLAK